MFIFIASRRGNISRILLHRETVPGFPLERVVATDSESLQSQPLPAEDSADSAQEEVEFPLPNPRPLAGVPSSSSSVSTCKTLPLLHGAPLLPHQALPASGKGDSFFAAGRRPPVQGCIHVSRSLTQNLIQVILTQLITQHCSTVPHVVEGQRDVGFEWVFRCSGRALGAVSLLRASAVAETRESGTVTVPGAQLAEPSHRHVLQFLSVTGLETSRQWLVVLDSLKWPLSPPRPSLDSGCGKTLASSWSLLLKDCKHSVDF